MIKLLGTLLILFSSMALGIKQSTLAAQRLAAMESIVQMLRDLEGELNSYLKPLPSILRDLLNKSTDASAAFLKCLNSNLSQLGEIEFYGIWGNSAADSLKILDLEELKALINLGHCLGHYELAMQIQAIDSCILSYQNLIADCRSKLPEKRKLYLGAACAGGLFLVILLI